MKIIKYLPLLFILTLYNSNAIAEEDCSKIKNNSSVNIIKKIKCKAAGGSISLGSDSKDSGEWKIWKKPEWMKKKN